MFLSHWAVQSAFYEHINEYEYNEGSGLVYVDCKSRLDTNICCQSDSIFVRDTNSINIVEWHIKSGDGAIPEQTMNGDVSQN